MKISVAMCTYNGAAFLKAQLESLASQRRPPDELVICDDQSVDETTELVRSWAKTVPFEVRFQVNRERLGSTRNFDQAISLCTGDLIALCDQDDVWLDHKLAEGEAKFLDRPDLGLWFTDAVLVDEGLRAFPETLWDKLGFDEPMQRMVRGPTAFEFLLSHFVVTGATLILPKRFSSLVRPIPTTLRSCIHDRWIGIIISAVAPVDCSSRPSMLYRQHDRQQLGVADRLSFAEALNRRFKRELGSYLDDLCISDALQERLSGSRSARPAPTAMVSLDDRIEMLRMRTRLPASRWRRFMPIAKALLDGRYHRQANGFHSALKDLVL